MCTSNLWIIDEMYLKLSELKKNKRFFSSKKDFTRNCVFTFEMIFCLITNLPRRSLSIEIGEILTQFNNLSQQKKQGTTSGFCKARKKIKWQLFEYISNYLVELIYSSENSSKLKRWKGFLLIAVDGSILDLIDLPCMKDKFGVSENQYTTRVQGRMMLAFDVLNKQIINCELVSYIKGEMTVAKEWISKMTEDSLYIYDRAYAGFSFMYLHQNNRVPYLIRCKVGYNWYVKNFIQRKEKDSIEEWQITEVARNDLKKRGFDVNSKTTLKVRLVKVILSTGEIEILITSLLNRKKYPHKIFRELYFKRWGVETRIDFLKNTLQLELSSGKNVESLMQDFYGTIIRSNIQSLIELDCEKEVTEKCQNRVYHYKINCSHAAGILKNNLVDLFYGANRKATYRKLKDNFLTNLIPVRLNRKFQRLKKPRKQSGKYRPETNYKKIA